MASMAVKTVAAKEAVRRRWRGGVETVRAAVMEVGWEVRVVRVSEAAWWWRRRRRVYRWRGWWRARRRFGAAVKAAVGWVAETAQGCLTVRGGGGDSGGSVRVGGAGGIGRAGGGDGGDLAGGDGGGGEGGGGEGGERVAARA